VNSRKALRYILALAVMVAAVYFFYLQFKRNADAISTFHFNIDLYYIFVSIIIGSFALLSGPIVWRMYVNNYLQNKLSYSEGYALYCTSTMFKYIPGKVWTYAAQIALMSSKEISNAAVIYINLASFICLLFVSAAYALYYYLFYLQLVTWGNAVLIVILLMMLDFIFIIWNNSIINSLIRPVNRVFKVEIQPIKTKRNIFIYTQVIYLFAYFFLGVALYFLARGINMEMPFANIFAVMATISISAIAGYLAFFSMGGLGVREGAMFFMLKQFSSIEIALILPIAARLLMTVVELFMGIIGIIMGIKCGYFPDLSKSPQKVIIEGDN
jgi:glycosyltransferase 2 family protein